MVIEIEANDVAEAVSFLKFCLTFSFFVL